MRKILFLLAALPLVAAAQALAPDLATNPAAEARTLDPQVPALFIAGDSTAARGSKPAQGWGVPFAGFFDPAKLTVANHARGGRSSRTFITEGLWDQLLARVRPGDFVLIQFGHNDADDINERPAGSTKPLRARGSLPGIGDDSRDIVNALTQRPETVRTYGWYVRRMIAEVKAKGATPILLSLTVRNIWNDGRIERGSGRYREWNRALAAQTGVAYVDLSRILADQLQALGQAKTAELFGGDHTHTNVAGAEFFATGVVAGLKGLRPPLFKDVFSAAGDAVTADAMGWLNLPEPANAARPTVLLIGDSTVRNGRGDGQGGQWGWGEPLSELVDPAKLNVVNRAVGGLSSRTFLTQGHWERARQFLKPGDHVIIQFGHNDSSPLNDDQRARGTLRGTGDETEAIENRLTKRTEVVHTYGWYLRQFVREAKAAGARVTICSPVPRRAWKDGRIARPASSYPHWAHEVATDEGVGFLDLAELVAERYDALGEAEVRALFADENTHTSRAGAELTAEIVATALQLPRRPE
jgi:lysophospholipase L1-like esterase